MGLCLRDGDYVPDGRGGLRRAEGREALLERALFRLTARRGTFPFLPELGSRLWQLGQVPADGRQSAAEQYVAEALAGEATGSPGRFKDFRMGICARSIRGSPIPCRFRSFSRR